MLSVSKIVDVSQKFNYSMKRIGRTFAATWDLLNPHPSKKSKLKEQKYK